MTKSDTTTASSPMTVSNAKDQWPDVIRKLEESVVGIKHFQSEAEEWKRRALDAEERAVTMKAKLMRSESKITMLKNRASRAGDVLGQLSEDERNPAEEEGSRARSSSSRHSPEGSTHRVSRRHSLITDSHLLDIDDDSCTYLVSDDEESTMSEICVLQGSRKSAQEKKIPSSERRKSIKGDRLSVGYRDNTRPNGVNGKSNKRFNEKKKKSPIHGYGDSSEDDSSVEAMNILNGYLELKGQYGGVETKTSRRER